MTAVEYIYRWFNDNPECTYQEADMAFRRAIEMEKFELQKAMMYALDEDGHTGDWKVHFVNSYVNKLYDTRPEQNP